MRGREAGGKFGVRYGRALLRLGGLVFCLLSPDVPLVPVLKDTGYLPFLARGGRIHAFARLSFIARYPPKQGRDADGSGAVTRIRRRFWRAGDQQAFSVCFKTEAHPVRTVAICGKGFRSCHVMVQSPTGPCFGWRHLTYPWLSTLVANAVARRGGLFLHAAAVGVCGQGIAFVGASGRGKTTMASLWDGIPRATVLGEDMVCVRRDGDGYRIYGLPWGRRGLISPKSFPLRAVCFIEHAGRNWAADRDRAATAKDLFVQSMPSHYDREGTRAVLDSVASVSELVPAYRLGFVPDRSVISYIENLVL